MSLFAVYVALLHYRKLRAHFVPREGYDFFARAVLLAQKLVTGKRNHLKTIRHIFVENVDQFYIAFVSECSLRSDVDNYRQFEAFYKVTNEHLFTFNAGYWYSFDVGFVDLAYHSIEGMVLE
jgi:hypothetical protein